MRVPHPAAGRPVLKFVFGIVTAGFLGLIGVVAQPSSQTMAYVFWAFAALRVVLGARELLLDLRDDDEPDEG